MLFESGVQITPEREVMSDENAMADMKRRVVLARTYFTHAEQPEFNKKEDA